MSYSLFKRYPLLIETLSWIPLGEFPTAVEKISGLCRRFGRDNLYIKRDDLSGPVYGGNKVRKLEFLLADALKQGKDFWFVVTIFAQLRLMVQFAQSAMDSLEFEDNSDSVNIFSDDTCR